MKKGLGRSTTTKSLFHVCYFFYLWKFFLQHLKTFSFTRTLDKKKTTLKSGGERNKGTG